MLKKKGSKRPANKRPGCRCDGQNDGKNDFLDEVRNIETFHTYVYEKYTQKTLAYKSPSY